MRHPIQKLYYSTTNKLLYAGIAGTLQVFDTASGALLWQWEASGLPVVGKRQKQEARSGNLGEQGSSNCIKTLDVTAAVGVDNVEGAALKKPKVKDISSSPGAPLVENVSTPLDIEPAQKRKRDRVSFREQPGMGCWSANTGCNLITSMVGTSTGRHVVMVTNEDKTVRVFDASKLGKGRAPGENEGGLQLLSERQMPKRLCALRLIEKKENMTVEEEVSVDGVVIICGDKFGDVYSLPLIHVPEEDRAPKEDRAPTPAPSTPASDSGRNGLSVPKPEPEEKAPRETGIITTARNKRAAGRASEMTTRNSIAKLEAKELHFRHKHLLGHVSLLLDVLPVSRQVEVETGEIQKRTWILSADKDEHIRVSRYPKSYVIEGFCLGHTSYVAKLLAPPWDMEQKTLISGGGDDYLLCWDWTAMKVDQRIGLRDYVMKSVDDTILCREKLPLSSIDIEAMEVDSDQGQGDSEFQISITGLWDFQDKLHARNHILVSVEGLPALIVLTERDIGGYSYSSTVRVSGNVLDVAVARDKVFVSVDQQSYPHQPTLIDCLVPENEGTLCLITSTDSRAEQVLTTINSSASWDITVGEKEKLDEFLYGAKNLRKYEADGVDKGGD